MHNGETSFWWRDLGGPPPRRPALAESIECDVAIVGGGYTGLWTAWYVKQARPDWRVVVLERAFCGFGASGRNGGWLSGLLAGSRERWAKELGRDAVIAAQREMFRAVGEVRDFCEQEGVDCDLVVGGSLDVARSAPAWDRLREDVEYQRSWGFGDDWTLVDRDDLRVRVQGARGGVFTPHCARVHPAKLVRGLAEAVERAGVEIFEDSEVRRLEGHMAHLERHSVRAKWTVRATEGYSDALDKRSLIPMNSSMIVTEPVDDDLGWPDGRTLRDAAHTFCYLQRTADGRIAIGGRGRPYRYGSRTDANGELGEPTVRELTHRLHQLFPSLRDVRIDHAWGGVLGVSRDWCPAVTVDRRTGQATAGGYVGDGVSTANLAGRTLRDLLTGEDTPLSRAPWAHHRPPRWEPEPLRYVGVHAVYGLYRAADAVEERTQKPSRLAALASRIAGR